MPTPLRRRSALLTALGVVAAPAVAIRPAPLSEATARPIRLLTHSLAPFCYEQGGRVTGFAVDLVRELALHTSRPIEAPTMVPFARGLVEAEQHADTAFFVVARRPEREAQFHFVGPLFESDVLFFARKDSGGGARTLDELRGLKAIAVARGNADHAFLIRLGFRNLQLTTDQTQALKMLASGRVDAAPMSAVVMPELATQAGLNAADFAAVGEPLYQSSLHLVFSRQTDPRVPAEWQRALDIVKSSPVYQRLHLTYLKGYRPSASRPQSAPLGY